MRSKYRGVALRKWMMGKVYQNVAQLSYIKFTAPPLWISQFIYQSISHHNPTYVVDLSLSIYHYHSNLPMISISPSSYPISPSLIPCCTFHEHHHNWTYFGFLDCSKWSWDLCVKNIMRNGRFYNDCIINII